MIREIVLIQFGTVCRQRKKQFRKMSDMERLRLVILGGQGVGKSCIIKRFLFKTYTDKYRATIEDLYNREYYFGNTTLKVSNQMQLQLQMHFKFKF